METINIRKGLLTNFFEGFDSATTNWEQVATKVPSTAASEDYAWLGSIPRMREMKGERVPKKLAEYTYTLPNKEYEASIAVKRADIKDDQTGKYGPLVRSIGESARMYPDEQVFGTLLPNGFTELAYDGQYFFDTDHPIGSTGNTQSNLLAQDLDATQYQAARTLLREMQDDSGRPVYNQNLDLLLIVPAELEATANTIVKAERNSDGASNVNFGTADVLVSSWLTDADSWFLLNRSGVVKPFIVQEREFIPFEALEDDSETSWWRKVHYYGTYWRGNFGYGLYQKIVGSTGAG